MCVCVCVCVCACLSVLVLCVWQVPVNFSNILLNIGSPFVQSRRKSLLLSMHICATSFIALAAAISCECFRMTRSVEPYPNC